MALPGARLLEVNRGGIVETDYRHTRHFRLYQSFVEDPERFIAVALADDDDLPQTCPRGL
jgi:predicted ATPase